MSKQREKIQALNHRQQARDKLSIWFGSTSNYYHGVKEVIANATDEIINNFDSGKVNILLHDDNKTITIEDTGRGINIDGETDGVKNYELLFLTLFAGTKYDDIDNLSSDTNTGTNGVGTCVINYTSDLFRVESFYDGYKHTVEFINGGTLSQDLIKEKCDKNKHGTIITFRLDYSIYTETVFDEEEIQDIVKHFAVPSNKITLNFKHKDIEKEYHYDNIKDYFEENIGNTTTSKLFSLPITKYEDDNEVTSIDLVLSTTPEVFQESYLNLTYLSEGGSINDGIIAGVRLFANKYCKDNNLFPRGTDRFLPSDIENSISFVCSVLSNRVEFKNQTKHSTSKQLYRKVAQKHVSQILEIASVEDDKKLRKFINHLLTIQKHNAANTRARNNLRRQLTQQVNGLGNKVEGFVDCKNHGKDSEVFIAEGKSALGSIVLARDANYQAAYPLRGKILNCLKADYATILKNPIIIDLIKILGCGIEADRANKDFEMFNIKNLRFGKIIIATDQDSDGFQIACLIATLIYRLTPTLLREGLVYIAQTPLYEVKLEDDIMIYFFSETEKERELPKIKEKYTLARCKGLGELDVDTMAETAMESETRSLIKLTVDDVEKMDEKMETWMGNQGEKRKKLISENLYKYTDLVD